MVVQGLRYPLLLWVSLLLVVSIMPASLWAAASAQLSSDDIDELENVRLTIRASETRQTETLDLSPLEADFTVLGTNTSSQYRFINGREQSWVDYQITLQPKRTGMLTVPAIQVGRDTTPTLRLRVRELSKATRQAIEEMVFFETELSQQRIYVQQQLVYIRRLVYSAGVQLYSDLPGAPELAGAVVLTMGEPRSGEVTRNGRKYSMVEQRYAIFPETSGALVIDAINLTASVRMREGNRVSRKGVRISTDREQILVDPVPASYPSHLPGLPAESVVLHQEINDTGPLDVGDTIQHELLVHIRGNVGSIAPPLPLGLDEQQFRSYPHNPVIEDETNGGTVVGARLQTTDIVPVKPGNLAVGEQQLHWWNTRTNRLEIATAPAIQLQVTGAAAAGSNPATAPAPPASTAAEPQLDSPTEVEPRNWLLIIGVGLGLAALGWFLIASRPVLARLTGHRTDTAQSQQRRLADRLKAASSDHEILLSARALLRARYQTPGATLNDWQARTWLQSEAPECASLLAELGAQTYANNAAGANPDETHPGASATARQLQDQLLALHKRAKYPASPAQGTPAGALPELYPSS